MPGKGGRRRIAAIALVLGILAGIPTGAGASTFGTDLNQAANAPLACGKGVLNQTLLVFFPPFGDNCMWSSVVVGSTSESLTAPGTGTVTTVRVKMGPNTGQMQINVVRFLFRQTGDPGKPELACCFVQAYGPVFTAPANTITTVPTNLPVTVEPTPPPEDTHTIAATDQLALSSLEPGVQVPLFATNNGSNDLSVLSYAWYPAPTAATCPSCTSNPIPGFADLTGFKVLMNADFTPAGAGGAPAGAPRALGIPAINLPKLTIPVRGNTATVPVQCLVVDCSGALSLQNLQQAGAARAASTSKVKKPRLVSYGTAKFSLKAGTTGKVKVKLNAAGRRLLKGHKKAKVWANVRFSSGGGAPKSAHVTLKH
jgi:hypothetical protein